MAEQLRIWNIACDCQHYQKALGQEKKNFMVQDGKDPY